MGTKLRISSDCVEDYATFTSFAIVMTALIPRFLYFNRCTHCKHVSKNIQVCSRCKYETYCSVECQRSDWKRHRKECTKSENDEATIGRNAIKDILDLPQFLEFAFQLAKDWPLDRDNCIMAVVCKSLDQTLPRELRSINGDIPVLYDIGFKLERGAGSNYHFDDGEVLVVLAYLSRNTGNYEFVTNLYINRNQLDRLSGASKMSNKPGMIKKNVNFKDYAEKGFLAQFVL